MVFFELAADYCNDVYGCELIFDEETGKLEGFICPSCGEPLYENDWSDKATENWTECPICGNTFGV